MSGLSLQKEVELDIDHLPEQAPWSLRPNIVRQSVAKFYNRLCLSRLTAFRNHLVGEWTPAMGVQTWPGSM